MLGAGTVRTAWVAQDAGPVDVVEARARLLRFALSAPTPAAPLPPPDGGSQWIPRGDADTAAAAVETLIRVMPKRYPDGTSRCVPPNKGFVATAHCMAPVLSSLMCPCARLHPTTTRPRLFRPVAAGVPMTDLRAAAASLADHVAWRADDSGPGSIDARAQLFQEVAPGDAAVLPRVSRGPPERGTAWGPHERGTAWGPHERGTAAWGEPHEGGTAAWSDRMNVGQQRNKRTNGHGQDGRGPSPTSKPDSQPRLRRPQPPPCH